MPCKKIYVRYNNNFSHVQQTYVVQKHTKISWPLSYFYGSYSQKEYKTDKFTTCRLRKFLKRDNHEAEIVPTKKKGY